MSDTLSSASTSDAVARYQYLLRTASPDSIERAHEEAFSAMTPTQRQEVLTALSRTGEVPADASASALARSATRLEVSGPGALPHLLGRNSGLGGTILASLAAGAVGSMAWGSLTGGDGVGGRPGFLSRLLGVGLGGAFLGGRGGMPGQGGFGGGPGGFGGGPGGFGGGPGGGPGGF